MFQGYRQKDSYMASQGPLQHTIEDFWRMIWEWRSCSIVMLTELEERGQVGARDQVEMLDLVCTCIKLPVFFVTRKRLIPLFASGTLVIR